MSDPFDAYKSPMKITDVDWAIGKDQTKWVTIATMQPSLSIDYVDAVKYGIMCSSLFGTARRNHRTEITDLGSKLAAQVLLADTCKGVVVPSQDETIGVYLLERDDELKRTENAQ